MEDVMGSGGKEFKVQDRRRMGKIKRHTKEEISDAHKCSYQNMILKRIKNLRAAR